MKTILVVDDKASVRTLVREYLTAEGFRVVTAEHGQAALYTARQEKPDLILLDIMMPELDGFAFIQAFRKESDTPVILLTAKLEESDKVIGLELGADDYITKPFGMRELVARIHTVMRRAGQIPHPSTRLQSGEILLDVLVEAPVVAELGEQPRACGPAPAAKLDEPYVVPLGGEVAGQGEPIGEIEIVPVGADPVAQDHRLGAVDQCSCMDANILVDSEV